MWQIQVHIAPVSSIRSMKFAIFLQDYFPYGGLQRDAVRLAKVAIEAGDSPTLVVSDWSGSKPPKIPIIELNSGGKSNHGKVSRFSSDCQRIQASGEYDTAITFSRVPGIPFYFCGDACFLEKFNASKPALSRHLPRYRFYLDNEKSLFGSATHPPKTHTFFLSAQEAESYQHHYHLTPDQFTTLPPWLNPPQSFDQSRETIRLDLFKELSLQPSDQLLLFVGSNFKLKRLESIIEALPLLDPHIHLAVCGQDPITSPLKFAESLGVADRVHFMGPRDDIPRWMTASDVLVHPSSRETAGMVLVEALTYGLPVTCTRLCGYAPAVKDAGGTLLTNNCPPAEISEVTRTMLSNLPELRQQALRWTSAPEHFQTAEIILNTMRNNAPWSEY